MEVDQGSGQKSDIILYPHWMAAHARLKNEFTEDEKCHNLMTWHNYNDISKAEQAESKGDNTFPIDGHRTILTKTNEKAVANRKRTNNDNKALIKFYMQGGRGCWFLISVWDRSKIPDTPSIWRKVCGNLLYDKSKHDFRKVLFLTVTGDIWV